MQDLLIDLNVSILEAMRAINDTGNRSLVVHNKGRFVSVLDESDIRRYLISGGSLKQLVREVKTPAEQKTVKASDPIQDVQTILDNYPQVHLVPALGENQSIKFVHNRSTIKKHIPISKPFLEGNEQKYLNEAVSSSWISSQGAYINKFQKLLSEQFNTPYVSLVSNGTVAIELALMALGVGKGDKVIVPDLTFGATINAVLRVGAQPVIIDIDAKTWNLNASLSEEVLKTEDIKCILAVELYGNPIDGRYWRALADQYKAKLVIDAAESFGASVEGHHQGVFADAYTFSFFGNKVITCGEGGAAIFNDRTPFNYAEVIKSHGITDREYYRHGRLGANFRMTNMQAAVGCAQLENIDHIIEQRLQIYENYNYELRGLNLRQPELLPGAQQAPWIYTVSVEKKDALENVINNLRWNGIDGRRGFYPLSLQDVFEEFAAKIDGTAAALSSTLISLPTWVGLKANEIQQISNILRESLND